MTFADLLPSDWRHALHNELQKPYWSALEKKVCDARLHATIYPPQEEMFAAFHACPIDTCTVLILGQDPYHGPGQAHGLSFSVPNGVPIPPSLRNMYKERLHDLHIPISTSGNLEAWAKQGVLLLNAFLSVEEKKAGSHAKWGWEIFTNAVISTLSAQERPMIFLLWGNFAKKKRTRIDERKHCIISSAHPSPLSAYRGFFGSKPYSKINQALEEFGHPIIDWS